MGCKKCGHFKPEQNQAYGYSGTICQCKKNDNTNDLSVYARQRLIDKLREKIAFLEGKIEVLEKIANLDKNYKTSCDFAKKESKDFGQQYYRDTWGNITTVPSFAGTATAASDYICNCSQFNCPYNHINR